MRRAISPASCVALRPVVDVIRRTPVIRRIQQDPRRDQRTGCQPRCRGRGDSLLLQNVDDRQRGGRRACRNVVELWCGANDDAVAMRDLDSHRPARHLDCAVDPGRAYRRLALCRIPIVVVCRNITSRSERVTPAGTTPTTRARGGPSSSSSESARRRRLPRPAAGQHAGPHRGSSRRHWPRSSPAASPSICAGGRPAVPTSTRVRLGRPGVSRVPAPRPCQHRSGRSSHSAHRAAEQGHPGGRGQLAGAAGPHLPPGGELDHRRHGDAEITVGRTDPARADRHLARGDSGVDLRGCAGPRTPRRCRRSSPAPRPRESAPSSTATPCNEASASASAVNTVTARAPDSARIGAPPAVRGSSPASVRRIVDQHLDVDLGRPQSRARVTGLTTTRTDPGITASTARTAPSPPRRRPAQPSSMSPATPAEASIQACRLRPAHDARGGRADLGGQVAGAVPVVDVHHGDPGCAGVEHRQQCGQSFERGSVAHRRRHRDDRCGDQTGDHAGQRTVHAGDDHDHPRPAQQVEAAEDAVQAGDADVHHQFGCRPRYCAVSIASRATGRSEVPAATITTSPPVGSGWPGGHASRPASASQRASGSSRNGRGLPVIHAGEQGDLGPVAHGRRRSPPADPASCRHSRPPRVTAATSPVLSQDRRSRPAPADRRPQPWSTPDQRQGERAPDWIPARSTVTKRKPASQYGRRTCARSGSPTARTRSASVSSTRATAPWCRTRRSSKPSRRRAASA